jgi:hypothetical protein
MIIARWPWRVASWFAAVHLENKHCAELMLEARLNAEMIKQRRSSTRENKRWLGAGDQRQERRCMAPAARGGHCPRTHAPSGRKNLSGKDWTSSGNRASLVPLRGTPKALPGSRPAGLYRLCGASMVAAQAASTQQGIPTMSLKKLSSNNTRRTESPPTRRSPWDVERPNKLLTKLRKSERQKKKIVT